MSGNPGVGTRGRLVDLCRAFHVQSFVRAFVVEDLDEIIEAGLLLQEVRGRRLGGFFLQGEMHAFMTAILLGITTVTNFYWAATRPNSTDSRKPHTQLGKRQRSFIKAPISSFYGAKE